MKTRIITAIVALLIFIPILVLGDFVIAGPVTLFSFAMAVLSLVGVTEVLKCVGEGKNSTLIPLYILSFALPLFNFSTLNVYTPAFIILLFYVLFSGVINNGKANLEKLLTSFALTFYVTASFGALTVLFTKGSVFFPLVFVGAWVTDTFAYFTGFFFGKHKLIPAVSPKKTVEGAVGGTFFAMIGYAVVGILYGYSIKNIAILVAVGLFASIISQLGDLSASLVKRHYGIKDYGKLFPGHGGVLDRFDSILAVSAFLYVVNLIFNF